MGIEAFVWNYRNGMPIGFDFTRICELLATCDDEWIGEFGCLHVHFHEPDDFVDIYLGKSAEQTNHVEGIMVSRPLAHPEYLRRIFRVMQLGNVMMFHSDETTPVFLRGADSQQYPADLLEQLGTPRYASTPDELLPRS